MKKKVWTSIGLAATALAAVPLVAAQALSLNDPLGDLMRFLFIDLTKYNMEGSEIFFITIKTLIAILVFSVVYMAVGKITKKATTKEGGWMPVVISIVLTLMSVVLIPNSLLGTIMQSYTAFVGVLVGLLPVIAGFALNHFVFKDQNGERTFFMSFMRGLIYFIIAWVMGTLGTSLVTGLNVPWGAWFQWGIILCVIAGLWNMTHIWGKGKNFLATPLGDPTPNGGWKSIFSKKYSSDKTERQEWETEQAEKAEAKRVKDQAKQEIQLFAGIQNSLKKEEMTFEKMIQTLSQIIQAARIPGFQTSQLLIAQIKQSAQGFIGMSAEIDKGIRELDAELTSVKQIGRSIRSGLQNIIKKEQLEVSGKGSRALKQQIENELSAIIQNVLREQKQVEKDLKEGVDNLRGLRNVYVNKVQEGFTGLGRQPAEPAISAIAEAERAILSAVEIIKRFRNISTDVTSNLYTVLEQEQRLETYWNAQDSELKNALVMPQMPTNSI